METKRIVITGVTRGLGRSLAREFIRLGHVVLGCGRSGKGIESLRDEFPAPHDFAAVDVSSDIAVKAWAERLLALGEAPDLVLNNAGLVNRNAPLWEVPSEEFSSVIDVNLKGTVHVIRHFVPAMIQRQKGVIVNFSSGWGRSADAEVAPYCASKWAIEGLTKAFALELPDGLATVSLNPGVINTEMLQSCFGASAALYPSPERWARSAAPFLLKIGLKENGKELTAPQ
jgi:NAD(P)-dependent dehydrogenase (short-subunit alcohol dehydrogenase family)